MLCFPEASCDDHTPCIGAVCSTEISWKPGAPPTDLISQHLTRMAAVSARGDTRVKTRYHRVTLGSPGSVLPVWGVLPPG